jgi:hypothetical protein
METFHLEATKFTPDILLDPENRIIRMSGKSYPENTFDFYSPMIDWVQKYFQSSSKDKVTFIEMEILYFNSSSSKLFFDFFDIVEDAQNDGHEIHINWIYDEENESAEEAGEDYKEDFNKLNFNLISKSTSPDKTSVERDIYQFKDYFFLIKSKL